MTKELLLARRQELEGKMAEQRDIQARGNADIERIQRRVTRARDEENAIGGAIQDVNYWGQMLEKAEAEARQQQSLRPAPPAPPSEPAKPEGQ